MKKQDRLKAERFPYVSRGGIKLAHALKIFHLEVRGVTAIDVGASTGGFTDCLLQRGAAKVYAIDVGYGLLAYPLQRDPRVVVMDRTNIRNVGPHVFSEKGEMAVIDVAFISLTKVLPIVKSLLRIGSPVVALVKPQFEVVATDVERGGIVRDVRLHQECIERIIACGTDVGLTWHGVTSSPITGADGNQEYFLLLRT